MTFGLDEKTCQRVLGVFKKYPSIQKAVIFGSRALGTYRPQSDIDIAIFGETGAGLEGRLRQDLDALSTPYLFDVVHYSLIENEQLKEHIDRRGKMFYEKPQ